jgi:hypothetical protein
MNDNPAEEKQDITKQKREVVLAKILPTRSGSTGITFAVDVVEPTKYEFPLTTLLDNVEMRGGSPVLALPDQNLRSVVPDGYPKMRDRLDFHRFLNPFVEAVHLAFSYHRPLVLTPDAIWLAIVQGFGHHVKKHAEELRGRIVRHEGQKELRVAIPSLAPKAWPALIEAFSAMIRENSDPVLYETLLCDFSTTTSNIRLAKEVALMDAYQRYFSYIGTFICGIPAITLEGNTNDWQRIRDRIGVLATYGLEWWTSRLAPILDEFVSTANGEPDLEFWKAIYKPRKTTAQSWPAGGS